MAQVKRLSGKRRAFIEHYFGDALYNATEAARRAGYGSPETLGSRMTTILAKELSEKEMEFRAKLEMSAAEVRERLTTVARDPNHKDHVRALELLAKIHGQFQDKVDIKVSRAELEAELLATLKQLPVSS